MPGRAPIVPDCIRRIRGSFSWIDHRFVHSGFLLALTREELLLYYFLVTVGDRNGVSYYDYEKICQLLKIDADSYICARNGLLDRKLIAYEQGVFQVLPLPERGPAMISPVPTSQRRQQASAREVEFQFLSDLLKHLKEAT